MSNYYSTSLGFILQNAGENSTTWGSYLNTNFQNLLEQAIAYQTTITMANANYTLSTTQGALNEARSAVLIITGNQNATYNVIVPSVQKVYVVTNSLNSGSTAYIQVSGQASYSIPNGDTVLVYCNGTTFTGLNYVASAGSAGGLTGTPNITVGTITSGAITSTGNFALTGNFNASGIITAGTQFNGSGAGLTGTASGLSIGGNASTTSQTDFSNLTIGSSQVLYAGNYNSYSPTLTGTGASGTWSINITGNAVTTSQTNFSNLTISSNQVLYAGNYNSYSPTLTGGGASGTWGINITGNAATATNAANAANATNATNATQLVMTDFSIKEVSGKIYFYYGATQIASIDSSGNFISRANITAYGTP
jgi:hypothetical protein